MDDIGTNFQLEDSFETRKRARDMIGTSDLVEYPKRVNYGAKAGHYLLKVLVPPQVAGSIIGKKGSQIEELKSKFDIQQIKLSQNAHYFPGTTERIALITGSPEGLLQMSDFVQDRIRNPVMTSPIGDGIDPVEKHRRNQQMRIVVTQTTAGMIIGKGGENIKGLDQKHQTRTQLSQKDEMVLGERIVTITGPEEGVLGVVEYVIEKIKEDNTSASITTLNYTDYGYTTTDWNSLAAMQGVTNSYTASDGYTYAGTPSGNDGSSMQSSMLSTLLAQSQQSNSQSQYTAQPSQSQPSQQQQQYSSYGQSQPAPPQPQQSGNTDLAAAFRTAIANDPQLAAVALQALIGNTITQSMGGGGGNQGGGAAVQQHAMSNAGPPKQALQPFISRPDDVKFKVPIPDSLVGRVLGKGGRTIVELQNFTGAQIKISQKGEYVPGTQNRIVYITGQPREAKQAQQLVLAKIEGEGVLPSAGTDYQFEQVVNNS